MIEEFDRVVLTKALDDDGLEAGDIGAVVMVHGGGLGFEVEFVTLDGSESRVVELSRDDVRPVGSRELPHARVLAEA